MAEVRIKPDTIVMVHGLWMTPRSWEHWKERYEARGYTVHAPAWPGFEVEVEALNADPTPIEELTVPAIMEHLESVVSPIEPAPILMGHSAGGVFTQLLMDRGYGAAGVASMNRSFRWWSAARYIRGDAGQVRTRRY